MVLPDMVAMKLLSTTLLGLLVATSVFAQVSELSQAELRAAVAEERGIATRTLVRGVEHFTGGEVVDIRAFRDGSMLVYRILYVGTGGEIETILVDGATGRAVPETSAVGRTITQYVSANPGVGNGNAFGQSRHGSGAMNANAGAGNNTRGGNGRGGGNGNGNSGGNGGGNGNGRNR
jgi:hypothetical protein